MLAEYSYTYRDGLHLLKRYEDDSVLRMIASSAVTVGFKMIARISSTNRQFIKEGVTKHETVVVE